MKKAIATAVTAALIVTIPGTNFVFAIETAGARVDSVRPIEAPAGIGSIQAAPLNSLSAASLDAAAAASLPEAAIISGAVMAVGSKAAPASAGAKASAVESLGAEVKQLGAETSGGPSAADSLNAFYSKTGGLGAVSDADVAVHEIGHAPVFLSPSTARMTRRQDGGALVGEAIVGVGILAGVGMAIPRTRNFIVYTITNLYNRFRSPDSVAKEILARLEEGHAQYNQRVSAAKDNVTTLERSMKQLEAEAAPIAQQLDKKSGELAAMMKDKEGDALAAVKNSASFKSAYAEAMTLQQQKSRIDGRVKSAQNDVAVAQTAYESAMKEREQFFNIEAERMAAVQSRMTEKDAGVLNQQMAAMKDKYQLKGGEQMDVLTGKTNEEVAKGKAAMDSVNSSGAAQKANAEEASRQRGNEDALDALIKSKSDNKGGSNVMGMDQATMNMIRYGTWVVGAALVFISPMVATTVLSLVGLAAVALSSSMPKLGQHVGGDIAVIGAGTLGIGMLATKFGMAVSLVSSNAFVAGAAVGVFLGVFAAINGYRHRQAAGASASPAPAPSEQAKAEIPAVQRVDIFGGIGAQMSRAAQAISKLGSAGKTAAGAAATNASSAASKGVDAVEGVADAAKQAADKMAQTAPADAPSTEELAQRAGSAVKKTAEAAGTIAGAAAKQAGAQARQAADKGIGAVEGMAQKAAEAAGAMSAQPGVDAPSAKELLSRLQNLSAKLGDIGMTVAENQVNKLEQKVDPNAPKMDKKGIFSLISRGVNAIMAIIGMKADQAMTQLESDPQYQAWLMKTQMAKAEKEYQGAVFAAAKAYHLKEIEIEQGKQESDKLAGQINKLLSPRVSGEAPSAQNEADARTLIASKKVVDLEVLANLKALGEAKQALDTIVERRATVIADATEKMIGVKAGLSDAEIGTLKRNIATLETDFVQSLGEINERFKAEVAARVAGGQAAIDAADGNPAVAVAEAKKRAEALDTASEAQKIKQQLAGK